MVAASLKKDIGQVNGMDAATAIAIDGGGSYLYRICPDNVCRGNPAYVSTGGTINPGDWVQLQLTSSATESTAIVAT